MTSQYGLTVDQGVARMMEAARIPGEKERRAEFRKILSAVHQLGYHDGSEDERLSE